MFVIEYIEITHKEEHFMALVKNEIPILEYDTEEKAVIMPGCTDYGTVDCRRRN